MFYDYTYLLSEDDESELYYQGMQLIWAANVIQESAPTGFDAVDYSQMLNSLLPVGAAWPRVPGSVMSHLLDGLAIEFDRVDRRALQLLLESEVWSTAELLTDYERVFGLPDPCVINTALTVQERRAALEARMTVVGGQSKRFFIEYAFRLGYTITIDEFFGEAGLEYTWRINSQGDAIRDFLVGESEVGEDLRSWGNEPLECAMNKLKPAHTVLLFGYGD